ncbi:hypothetical protein BRD17_00930 [Halobacteriales archaeon SW_7_68_16]|nr:MAG: hypothetical protein BRD17_00930 [Halobacteriales archaeon SW_7_68_16]
MQYEAAMMIGEDTDAVAVRESTLGAGTLGYYDFAADTITIVSENTTTPRLDEITLAQELFHALQDQQFPIASYDRSTIERRNAVNGIVEGDGNFVDYRYDRRCTGVWNGTCLRPRTGSGGGDDRHRGLTVISLQPYSDGPAFVRSLYRDGGWAAVNAVYDRPPASTEQTIHTERYRRDPPTQVSFSDRSSREWSPLSLDRGVNYATFGEAGLYAIFLYPGYASNFSTQIVSYPDFLNAPVGQPLPEIDPYDYAHPLTTGWDGDTLVPYVRTDSTILNETGYVWRLVWDTPTDAAEFARGYRDLLTFNGARPVDARPNTYRIPDDEPFGDAIALVTIVNAPTVDALNGVRTGTAPRAPRYDPDATIAFPDQSTDGSAVTVAEAGLPEGGFVAIHDAAAYAAGVRTGNLSRVRHSVVGVSDSLPPGTYRDLRVSLPDGADTDGELLAVAVTDLPADDTYTFGANGSTDRPYLGPDAGQVAPVTATATVTTERVSPIDANGDGSLTLPEIARGIRQFNRGEDSIQFVDLARAIQRFNTPE